MNNDRQIKLWNSSYGRIWADNADALDQVFAPLNEELLTRAAIQPDSRILDVGCGAGALALLAATRVGEAGKVIGVDISEPLIKVASERALEQKSSADFIAADAVQYQAAEPFDIALSRFGNSYFTDHTDAFVAIREQMKPGGKLVSASWMSLHRNPWARMTYEICIPYLIEVPKLAPIGAPGPFAFADDEDIAEILQAAGWRDILVEPWEGDMPFPGETCEEAAALLLTLGPMAKIAKSQGVDLAPIQDAVAQALSEKANADGAILLDGNAWIFSAYA